MLWLLYGLPNIAYMKRDREIWRDDYVVFHLCLSFSTWKKFDGTVTAANIATAACRRLSQPASSTWSPAKRTRQFCSRLKVHSAHTHTHICRFYHGWCTCLDFALEIRALPRLHSVFVYFDIVALFFFLAFAFFAPTYKRRRLSIDRWDVNIFCPIRFVCVHSSHI